VDTGGHDSFELETGKDNIIGGMGVTTPRNKLSWYKKRLFGSFSKAPPDLELSEAQYSTIESAGEIKLRASERGQLLELLRRYQRDLLAWTSAPRAREAREVLEALQGDAGELSERLQSVLQVRDLPVRDSRVAGVQAGVARIAQ
jgi:hypothetical protein